MILSAHQPGYLPWLGYFHKIIISDVFIVLDSVQFERNSFTNRNKIKSPQGEIWITIPLSMKGHLGKTIMEMNFIDLSWQKKHLNSIIMNYKRATYFDEILPVIEFIFETNWETIHELFKQSLNAIVKLLAINTNIYYQSEYGFYEKKQDLILEICKQFNADIFVFGKQGTNYVDNSIFSRNNIKVIFQDYLHPIYTQLWGDFIPNLSIIDLLMNQGIDNARNIIMQGNLTKNNILEN